MYLCVVCVYVREYHFFYMRGFIKTIQIKVVCSGIARELYTQVSFLIGEQ